MTPSTNLYCYVWRTGRVEHGSELPEGAILLASGRSAEDFEAITAGCRLMYDGRHVIGSVYDAWRAEAAETPEEKRLLGLLSCNPDDTPEKALDRWLAWMGLGPYAEQQAGAPDKGVRA